MLGQFLAGVSRRHHLLLFRFLRGLGIHMTLRHVTGFYNDPITLGTIGFLILCTLTYFLDPTEPGLFPPCPFLSVTGIYCPGCGSLRASHALLHGELIRALDFNALYVISIPFILLLFGIDLWRSSLFHRFYASPVLPRLALGLVLTFWIARNFDRFPLTVLAP